VANEPRRRGRNDDVPLERPRTVAHPAITGDDAVMVATVRDREPAKCLEVTSFQKTKLQDGRLVEARRGELSSNEAEPVRFRSPSPNGKPAREEVGRKGEEEPAQAP
jgi:hypothetical protein